MTLWLVGPEIAPGIHKLKIPFNKEHIEELKKYPGCSWDPKGRYWYIAHEGISWLRDLGARVGVRVAGGNKVETPAKPRKIKTNEKLYPYQVKALQWLVEQRVGGMLAFEMGLGKTVTALQYAQTLFGKILVVCPAIVRSTWYDEIQQWCPGESATVYRSGKEIPKGAFPQGLFKYHIISYALISKIKKLDKSITCVILDESHYLANPGSGRSRAVRRLLESYDGRKILLTGTPIVNSPENLWHQLDTLYPRRYGTYHKFKTRYCEAIENAYANCGFSYSGLNSAFSEELQNRLGQIAIRVTKHEAADYLPTIITKRIEVDTRGSIDHATQDNYYQWLDTQRDYRVASGLSWVENRLAEDSISHLAILCKFKKTVDTLFNGLARSAETVIKVTGDLSPEERITEIRRARGAQSSIVIATLDSIGIGINAFRDYDQVLVVELSYSPANTLQALARFVRVGSTGGTTHINLLVSSAPLDQLIYRALKKKLDIQGQVMKQGVTEEKLENLLTEDKETDEQFGARLLACLGDTDDYDSIDL